VHCGDICTSFRVSHDWHKWRGLQIHRVGEHCPELCWFRLVLLHVMHLLIRLLHHFLGALILVGLLLLLIPILTVDRVSIVVIFKHHVSLILHLVGVHVLHELRSVLLLVVKLLAAVVLAWLLVVLHRLRLLHLLVVKHGLLRRLKLLLLQKRSVAIATHSYILVHSRVLAVPSIHWLLIHSRRA